ncbi:acyltransferase family protein [Phytoactinopolyspora mesophila]|uniref:Acyltransferase family protein n=1 Tax=Phytoactinopolyspora mesophila TaxID=2650750 RepID=A0A7K3M0R0_9ACTN|nr:acyltransferase [Phytoactinopolyspora mesophila]NDL56883.1 acyltransferase family protein [Phytoactinopolyspora mesophila]
MSSVSNRPNQLRSLTGYRFLLASAVVFGHVIFMSGIFTFDHPVMEANRLSIMLAAGAVSSFFILSGFVLTWSRRDSDTTRGFYRRRIVKIFPNHVVTLGLMLILLWVTTAPSPLPVQEPTLGEGVANLLLVHTWYPDLGYVSGGTSVTWSLASEMFFYLLFPLIIGPLCAIRARNLWAVTLGVAALVVSVPALATFVTSNEADPMLFGMSMSVEYWWLIYFFPPVRLLEFVLGILLARVVLTGQWPTSQLLWPVLGLVAVLAAEPVMPDGYLWGAATCLPAAAMICTLAMRDLDGQGTPLARPPMVRFGEASYALYVVHMPVIYAIRHLAGPEEIVGSFEAVLLAVAMFVASVLAALVLWRTVEVPMMRRFARPRTPEHPEPVATLPVPPR